uniref:Uncharacterized protein n=1 Tax=Brugia malayi TaxID=6279 RepID=A0A7I4NIZ8_BRUMA
MSRIVTLIVLLLQNVFILHETSASERLRTISPNLKSVNSSTEVYREAKKVDEILHCCKNKCSGKNDTAMEEICNEKLTTQTTALRSKTVKMVLPLRKCVPCPCPTTPTTCPVMPVDHCPCSVKVNQLLPCPIALGIFQAKNRRRKRQMTEVIVPLDDKLAIEYLRKLGYVEEFNLSSANICHPTNLLGNVLSPDERSAAVIPIPVQPFQGALSVHQQIPVELLANSMPQQFAFGGISGVQAMNLPLTPQEQVPSGSAEQPKLKDLLASPSDTRLKMNEDCQPSGRRKSATATRSRITLITFAVIVWIRSQERAV